MKIIYSPAAAAQFTVASQEHAIVNPAQIPVAIAPVIAAFEELDIAYCIAGSVAASA